MDDVFATASSVPDRFRLVLAASCENSAQADLARMRLAMEDIPAFLGNAALVTWFWQYSNATGGARVYVSACDAERADAILRPSRETVPAAPSPWECSKCGEQIDEHWKTCWRCGTSIDGENELNFLDEPVVAPCPVKFTAKTWAIIVVGMLPLVLFLSHGSLLLLLEWCAAIAVTLVLKSLWPGGEGGEEPAAGAYGIAATDSAEGAAEEVPADGYMVIEETVLRAWQAAFLSLWFLPLALYAIWLLLRVSLLEEPLKPRELRRYVGAWVFIAFWLGMFFGLPLL
jgi:hypothetical protein